MLQKMASFFWCVFESSVFQGKAAGKRRHFPSTRNSASLSMHGAAYCTVPLLKEEKWRMVNISNFTDGSCWEEQGLSVCLSHECGACSRGLLLVFSGTHTYVSSSFAPDRRLCICMHGCRVYSGCIARWNFVRSCKDEEGEETPEYEVQIIVMYVFLDIYNCMLSFPSMGQYFKGTVLLIYNSRYMLGRPCRVRSGEI